VRAPTGTKTVAKTVAVAIPAARRRPRLASLGAHADEPAHSALPDLVPLSAWAISTAHDSGRDVLQFAATVWEGANGPLDVEGFRPGGSPVMTAYQYFYKNGP